MSMTFLSCVNRILQLNGIVRGDTDTLTASAKAYVNALNNLFARKEKTKPETAIASGF